MKIFSRIHKKYAILFGAFMVGVFLLVTLFVSATKPASAFVAGLPFGGMIGGVTFCPFSANVAIAVVGVKGGLFTYEPELSTLFAYWMLKPGSWILGNYWPGTGVCVMSIWPTVIIPTLGTISIAGTSL